MLKLTKAALLAGALVTPMAMAEAREMTAEDVARLQSVGSFAVSPDGTRIAFQQGGRPDVTRGEDDGSYTSQLYVGTGPNRATAYLPDDMSVSDVKFSPDGAWVSFLHSGEDEERGVYAVPLAGGTYRRIAGFEDARVLSHVWAPDGQSVMMLVAAETDAMRDKQSDGGFNAIVYEEEAELPRLFRARVLAEGIDEEPTQIAVPGYVNQLDVSGDGRFAIIASAPTPQVDDQYVNKRISIVDFANGKRTEIETPGKIGDVEIAPDGRQLSLVAGVDQNDPAATTLHLVDVASGAYRALNAGAAEAVVDAEWLPDGRLATIVHTGVASSMRIYNTDGSVASQQATDMILTGIEAAGGTIAVTANTARHPSELFTFANGNFTRWTTTNPWLSEITFAPQEAYRYTARDGQQVEGVLIRPLGVRQGRRAPLILDVHGGPEAHESNGWVTSYSNPGQVAAGQGYAVFLPNYRGSTAYGTAFSKQHTGNYTDPEFTDLVDAKRALVADGIADADRTGITGGSYGGYASAWGATHDSAEYAAAVMFVGISNQISKFGTTDIPYEMYNVHSRKWPWDDWQGLLEVSPIYHVDKAQTPILIMHGEEDTRVSPSQSYELYRAIKVRKPEVPVRLVLYPGEGHGNARAASRYDCNLRMMRWLDTYLKTGDRDAPLPDSRPTLAEGAAGTEASGDE